ncbi:hypothetical protein D7Y21_09300 [Corallococcus sp. AB045]|nr:hypothetical protein D7Y21_09300 [Corallococcus sp. AB045]
MGRNRGGLVAYVEAQLERDIALGRPPPSAFSVPPGFMSGDSPSRPLSVMTLHSRSPGEVLLR